MDGGPLALGGATDAEVSVGVRVADQIVQREAPRRQLKRNRELRVLHLVSLRTGAALLMASPIAPRGPRTTIVMVPALLSVPLCAVGLAPPRVSGFVSSLLGDATISAKVSDAEPR